MSVPRVAASRLVHWLRSRGYRVLLATMAVTAVLSLVVIARAGPPISEAEAARQLAARIGPGTAITCASIVDDETVEAYIADADFLCTTAGGQAWWVDVADGRVVDVVPLPG